MKRYLLYVVLSLVASIISLNAMGQQLGGFEQRLSEPDSLSGARSNVTIHFSAEEAMEKYNTQTSPKESYQGYRIRIFASNNQTARTDAEAAIEHFKQNYAVPVYFAYENPYFLVTCGNCLTHEEAIILLSKVRIHFPKAFIVMCEIPAQELLYFHQPQAEEVAKEEPTEVQSTEEKTTPTEVQSTEEKTTPTQEAEVQQSEPLQ